MRAKIAVLLLCPTFASTSLGAQNDVQKNDYSDGRTWLCRPGRSDACAVDQRATVISTSGDLSIEQWAADPNAPIDCFYVYPTVSFDPTPNSDMNPGAEEIAVIRSQFARFGSVCRTYAPLYRQVTMTALNAGLSGKPMAADRELGYNDVLDAWKYYLAHDNQGRGVVLLGHSQGSIVLTELIRREIDGKPIQRQIVSAILPGANIAVPRGKEVGGAFTQISLCHSVSQTGCLIAWTSFRANAPPPSNTRFGVVEQKDMIAACVNPAALGGGAGELHSYLRSTARNAAMASVAWPWVLPTQTISTAFVSVPGLLRSQCVANEHASYLAVSVLGDPADPRADEIPGDMYLAGHIAPDWGLHLIDISLAQGNLIDVVRQQSHAYVSSYK